MERENVALIQKVLEAFARGDVETILESCTDDCVFYNEGPAVIPYAGKKIGRAGILDYFTTLMSTQSNTNVMVERVVAQADMVIALGRYTAVVKSTNKTIDSNVALTWQIVEGKVKNFTSFANTAAVAASYTECAAAAG